MHIIELDARAVRASIAVVSGVAASDLGRPTPCAEWTLADLLAHMTVQHYGFAAAAAGRGADPAVWHPRVLGDDPVADYVTAAEHVLAAFAADGGPERGFALPEISTTVEIPAATAIGFHFVDYVVHSWDVARSLGVPVRLPADLVQAALPVAEAVPDDERRGRPGAAFGPGLPAPAELDPLDRIVALLGRSPAWPA